VTGGWRKFQNYELHHLFSSSKFRAMKPKRIRWGDMKCIKNSLKNLKGSDHLQDLGVDGKIILKWILEKQSLKFSFGLILFRKGIGDRLL
jgi:hypothetical protein